MVVKIGNVYAMPVIVGGNEVCPDRKVYTGSAFKLHVEAEHGAHLLPRKKRGEGLALNRLLTMGGGDVQLEPVTEHADGGFLLGAGSYCVSYGDKKSAMIVIPSDLSLYADQRNA